MNELTLNQVEQMREAAGEKIAEAIYEFERLTGLRVDAVNLVPYYEMRFRFVNDIDQRASEDSSGNSSKRKLKIKFNVSI